MKPFTEKWRESTTLKFVTAASIILMGKYMVEGVTITYGVGEAALVIGPFGEIGAIQFGTAFALVLAPWVHGEWRRARYPKDAD